MNSRSQPRIVGLADPHQLQECFPLQVKRLDPCPQCQDLLVQPAVVLHGPLEFSPVWRQQHQESGHWLGPARLCLAHTPSMDSRLIPHMGKVGGSMDISHFHWKHIPHPLKIHPTSTRNTPHTYLQINPASTGIHPTSTWEYIFMGHTHVETHPTFMPSPSHSKG